MSESQANSAPRFSSLGFVRTAWIAPRVQLADPEANVRAMWTEFEKLSPMGPAILVTPELSLTGYTCEDWFLSQDCRDQTDRALAWLLEQQLATEKKNPGQNPVWIVGAPVSLRDGRRFNSAVVLQSGKIKGIIPKRTLPNFGEFYDQRWFASGENVDETSDVLGQSVRIYAGQRFDCGPVSFGIEICQDLWSPRTPSDDLALGGAHLIFNLSASNETIGKARVRQHLVVVQSLRTMSGYLYLSSGLGESSKDTVFGGHVIAAESGDMITERLPFDSRVDSGYVDFDVERLHHDRGRDVAFQQAIARKSPGIIGVPLDASALMGAEHSFSQTPVLFRPLSATPFVDDLMEEEDALMIQAQGLWSRAVASKVDSLVVGISGGLDSALALLVADRVRALSGRRLKLIGVPMPAQVTSQRTQSLATDLMQAVHCDEIRTIPIQSSVEQHLQDLVAGLTDAAPLASITLENAQARERTQLLFDLANQYRGLVVGTGDLSELALGWCTYNADHMAHYAVNSGLPKTSVQKLVRYHIALSASRTLTSTLQKILDAPITPELLPDQVTEDTLGPYVIHDFILWHTLVMGASAQKTLALARMAFKDHEFSDQVLRTHEIFYKRFYSQQFKRTTLPPGPKIHRVSLSPRSDFRLPDEIAR